MRVAAGGCKNKKECSRVSSAIAMLRAAWWTYAVLALWIAGAGARVYERCELARDLRSLGVQADHVSTWVCIAFHESRFDTTANNLHSGDHGLLQISELYWCGGGKACGLSCESLRDDDISDDVKCALQVYKEHTRLQGDGFLAWVVYPQHCKHNTKKYLADCDDTLKNASTKTIEKSRALDVSRRTNLTLQLHQSIDALLPPYISMTSTSGHSRNEISFQDKNYQNKWQTQHLINIDDLSLPILGHKKHQKTESLPSSGFASQELDQSKTINNSELRNKFTTDNPAATKK
uniref:Lysozyme n=1 Tax=Leguminivora glycinivorella TaxID=1035111 RepID=A0A346RAE9_9NEOP|nr:c-type lysozyme 3 [Leguminivora glycinivorella]